MRYVLGCFLLLSVQFFTGILYANSIKEISIEPTYECAGVLVTLNGTDEPATAVLEVREQGIGIFKAAHKLVRYDLYHLAGNLFNLRPATNYEIKVKVDGTEIAANFTTRAEFVMPGALRVVNVTNYTQLSAAVNAALPGDKIVLAAGTYTGGALTISRSGTPEHPIVISGTVPAGEETKPIDQRQGLPVFNATGLQTAITITGSYVVVEGIRVNNISTGDATGIRIDNTHHGVVQNCQFYCVSKSGWTHCLYITAGGANGGRHLIQNNYIQDTGTPWVGQGYGILQEKRPGPGTVIRRNIITGVWDGINPSGDEADCNNTIIPETHPDVVGTWSNHDVDVYENDLRICVDDDIETDGICVNLRIFRNNLSTAANGSCVNAVSISPVMPGPVFFIRNIAAHFKEGFSKYNCSINRGITRNIYFYHNTVYNLSVPITNDLVIIGGDTPAKNIYSKNNIFFGGEILLQTYWDLTYFPLDTFYYNPNYWYSTTTTYPYYKWKRESYYTFAAWRAASGQEASGYFGDPLLNLTDYSLQANSPAIDKGELIPGVNDTYVGSGPDMGAWENLGGVDTTLPSVPTNLTATAASSSQINLTWTASTDNVGVSGYNVYRDGTSIGFSPTTTYSDTGLTANMTYSYTVSAYDAAGNNSERSTPVSAIPQNQVDTTLPTVAIAAPANNATVNATITLSANASDNVGVVGVQFQVDSNNAGMAEDTTAPYSVTWDSQSVPNGSHTITAVARDAAGNSATAAAIIVTVSNTSVAASNLSQNRPVTYSAQENSTNKAANVVDGIDNNPNDRWSAQGYPQWVEIDLGANYLISTTQVVCYLDRAYRFKVEARRNGSSAYTQVVDRTNNAQGGSAANPITDTFGETLARYVRLTVTGCATTTDNWVSLLEVRVYGRSGTTNLSQSRPVTYSAQENSTNNAANVVDGIDTDPEDRWSALGYPQWVEIDLGVNYKISKTQVVCYLDRAYRFKVEARRSGSSSYTQVVNRLTNTQSGSAANPITDTFAETTARYVRVTVTGCATAVDENWVSLLEVRVSGK